jgi:hypothetical protein
MSVSQAYATGTPAPYKNINVHSVTTGTLTAQTLDVGAITSTGTISGTNITQYGQYMRIEPNGAFGSSFGNIAGTPERLGTGHYKYTYAATLPRVPFSIQITPDQRSTDNPTLDRGVVVISTQALLEWKLKDSSGNLIDGSAYIAIMG